MLTVTKKSLEATLSYQEEPLLHYCIEYPEFCGNRYEPSLAFLNKYYRCQALAQEVEARGSLFDQAVQQYQQSIEHGYPILIYESQAVFTVTYCEPCAVSLYTDRYLYTGGAHGSTTRDSQTWNLQKCWRIHLQELIKPCGAQNIQQFLFHQILEQSRQAPENYFEDTPQLVQNTFDWRNYYATKDGIVLYFQQYDIAPYSSGIPSFFLPYSSCVLSPESTCFVI